jgi:two-component system, LuxR family, response regulator FixJ
MIPVVAVVDDDAAVCDSTRFLLETYGFEARTYEGAAAFLREDPAVDCVIVDYQMPGLNGLEFVAELRRQGNQAPSIMITATIDPMVERRAAELGIRRILRKPLSNQVLLDTIREALK